MKKIIIGKVELTVEDCYAYRYDLGKGKEVLRIKILEENHSHDEIVALKNPDNLAIEYWVDDEKKNDYEGYSADFSSNYIRENGRYLYSIEITRKSRTELELERLKSRFEEESKVNKLAITELSDILLATVSSN